MKKQHKYNARKTVVGRGECFPSKLEASVHWILKLREKAGEIRNVTRYPSIRLKNKCTECGAPAVNYKVDFSYECVATGETVYVEAKGVEDRTFKRNKRLWKQNPPGKLEIWKGTYRKPFLSEVVSAS